MVQQILLLGAGVPYDFQDEQTKRQISGVKCHYILREMPDASPAKGYTPAADSITLEAAKEIKAVPGIYAGSFKLKNVKGKAQLALEAVEFMSEADL